MNVSSKENKFKEMTKQTLIILTPWKGKQGNQIDKTDKETV